MTFGNTAIRHGLSLIVFLKWIDYNVKLFLNLKFVFEVLDENRILLKRIVRREYLSNCNELCISCFVLTNFTNIRKVFFFKFQIRFRNFGRIPKNI